MLIASCTSYPKRISNLPVVVDSILRNSCPPDKVIINLSRDEFPNCELPKEVQEYINAHKQVFVNWLDGNWKVYKKFLPILKEYQDALIFPFDDDIIYPDNIIEEAMEVHKKFPNLPVTCNHYWYKGLNAHCGAGSLIQAKHFEGWEKYIDKAVELCPASDVFYTQLVAMNGYFYKSTSTHFPQVWEVFNEGDGYSRSIKHIKEITQKGLYEILGQQVKMIFSEDETRPIAILNIYAVPRGLSIEEELLSWVSKYYNVIVVEHDGTKFEYPGLSLANKFVTNNDVTVPIMYIHSKGSYHVRRESEPCRRMWRNEFTKRRQEYFDVVNTDIPMIAAPYQGELHRDWNGIAIKEGEVFNIPYENGWIANPAAVKQMNVFISNNRYDYEVVIYRGIEMRGMRKQHIAGEDIPSRRGITADIMTF